MSADHDDGVRLEVQHGAWRFRAFGPPHAPSLRMSDEALGQVLSALHVLRPLGPLLELLRGEDFAPAPREGGGWWLSRDEAEVVTTSAAGTRRAALLPLVADAFNGAEASLAGWLAAVRGGASPVLPHPAAAPADGAPPRAEDPAPAGRKVGRPVRTVTGDRPPSETVPSSYPSHKRHPRETEEAFRQRERSALERAIEAASGNISKAALGLGIPRRTLYRRLADYGLHGTRGG